MTRRMIAAVRNPYTNVLGHCTGRLVTGNRGVRKQSQFDARAVFEACRDNDTAVEINSRPERRDPPTDLLELARDLGCLFSIDSDAHAPGQLDMLDYGCARADEAGIDALITVGGDGSLTIGHHLCRHGLRVIGVPKTIDNDLEGTDVTFGFDTALQIATEAIDRLHTTAESHHRILVVEVMGRDAGWIALYAGVAGGADAILIPEIPFDLALMAKRLREREEWGARFSIVVVAEGAFPKGGKLAVLEEARSGYAERLGGMAVQVAEALGRLSGKETRSVVLGHLQRGGAPTSC